jgi:hypothetical protein
MAICERKIDVERETRAPSSPIKRNKSSELTDKEKQELQQLELQRTPSSDLLPLRSPGCLEHSSSLVIEPEDTVSRRTIKADATSCTTHKQQARSD